MVKSAVWVHFKVDFDNKCYAICQICSVNDPKRKVKRGELSKNKSTRNLSTNPMIRHLNKFHKPIYDKTLSDIDELNKKTRAKMQMDRFLSQSSESESGSTVESSSIATASTSSRPVPSNLAEFVRQPTLPEMEDIKKLWADDNIKKIKVNSLIAEMICLDNQPFSIVEDKGFVRLLKHAFPLYKVPHRTTFSRTIIPEIYNRVRAKFTKQIESAEAISMTSDIWTNQHSNESFISISVHWVSKTFVKENAVLEISHFPTNHTASNICEKLTSICQDWNIPKEKIHIIVTDNAANITRGCHLAQLTNGPCSIHTLQLVLKDAIFSQRAVSDVISISKNIVGQFNRSSVATSKLKQFEVLANIGKLKLKQDVETRWNSTFYMLKRLQEVKTALTLYSAEHQLVVPNANQWELMSKTIRLLEPFEEVTNLFSRDDSSMSMVIPTVKALTLLISSEGVEDKGVQTMKKELKHSLITRFQSFTEKKTLIIATVLDPRYKLLIFDKIDHHKIKTWIKEEVVQFLMPLPVSESSDSEIDSEGLSGNDSQMNVETDMPTRKTLMDCFDELLHAPHQKTTEVPAQSQSDTDVQVDAIINEPSGHKKKSAFSKKVEKANDEIECYLNSPSIDKKENIFVWWRTNEQLFRSSQLHKIAAKYFSTPPSSVYSERMFSQAGNIYTAKRSCLAPELVDKLLFLHGNLEKINFNY